MSASPRSSGSRSSPSCDGIVLAVAVDAHGDVVVVLEREREAGLHGTADAEVERQAQRRTRPSRPRRSAVRSLEPSSITTTSRPGSNARSSSMTRCTVCSSFSAGTIATRRSSASPAERGRHRSSAVSDTGHDRHAEAEQLEQPARARCAYVCSSSTRSRARRPISSACAGIGEQLAIRGDRLVRIGDDEQLAAGLEPALDPLVRVGDDRGAAGGELERPAGRRCRHRRMRAARDVEVDARGGDRAREDVERDVADHARAGRRRRESRGRRARSRAPADGGSARRRARASTRGGTCRRSRRRRRRAPSRPASGANSSGSAAQKSGSARRAPSSSSRGMPPSELESTRSYSDGSAPW